MYMYIYSRLYRRESWNCSIKQPLGSVQQISPATRVYPVIVGVSPRLGFPAKLSSLVLRDTPSFRRKSISRHEIGDRFLDSREKWLETDVNEEDGNEFFVSMFDCFEKRRANKKSRNKLQSMESYFIRSFARLSKRNSKKKPIIVIHSDNSSAR